MPCEKLVEEWGTSVDPCKLLVSHMVKRRTLAIHPAANRARRPRSGLDFRPGSKPNSPRLQCRETTKEPEEGEDLELKEELEEVRDEIQQLERALGLGKASEQKNRLVWDQYTENYYNAYRKLVQRMHKFPVSQSADLTPYA